MKSLTCPNSELKILVKNLFGAYTEGMWNMVSGASSYFADDRTPKAWIGRFVSPSTWNSLRTIIDQRVPWAADNDCFTGLKREKYLTLLKRLSLLPAIDRTHLMFVTVPDVPCDHAGTLTRFRLWYNVLNWYGLPKAFVIQNGAKDIPWDDMEALFVGGDTAWKLGMEAARLVGEAKQRGKWVHMGRVNSIKRMRYAMSIGCDSVDGTGYSKYNRREIPKAARVFAYTVAMPL